MKLVFNMLLLTTISNCAAANAGDPAALLMALRSPPPVRVYFSDPRPTAAPQARFAARNRLLALIAGARNEIRVWAYGLNESRIIAALADAAQRGVRIKFVGSSDQNYSRLERAFIHRGLHLDLAIRRRSGLQHLKLVVIDEATAFTGTGNFTRSGFLYNHNAFIEIDIRPEYIEQWSDFLRSLEREDESRNAFLSRKNSNPEPDAPIGPVFNLAPGLRALVAPAHGRLIQTRLIRSILNARYRIRFMIFSFTDPVIAAAMLRQAGRGVSIQGVLDDPRNSGEVDSESTGGRLNQRLGLAKAEIYLEGNRRVFAENGVFHGGHLHHKTLLIDDRRVLTGSYNWSLSARDRNLEALLEIDDPAVAFEFHREFGRIQESGVLLGRPPLLDHRSEPAYDRQSGRVCLPAGDLPREATVFSGSGPYFRALYFPAIAFAATRGPAGAPAAPRQFCASLADSSRASAGIHTGRRYRLAPDDQLEYRRPCAEARDCDLLKLTRADLDEGWLWLAPDARLPVLSGVTVWDRGGFSPTPTVRGSGFPEIPLRADAAPGFYRFAPTADAGSDALLFLRGGDRVYLACVQYGPTLETALREFLSAFAAEREIMLRCIQGE